MKQHDSINYVQRMLIDAEQTLFGIVPLAVKNIIEGRQWVGRKDKHGNEFTTFKDFVEHARWQGLETTVENLLLYCRDHENVRQLILKEVERDKAISKK